MVTLAIVSRKLVKNWSCDDSKCVNIDVSQKLVKNWSYDDSKCRNIGFHIIGQILVTGIAKTQIGRNLADKVPDQGHDQLFPCGEGITYNAFAVQE